MRLLNPGDSINRGLEGFWPLDDGAGAVAQDVSPGRRMGALTNFGLSSGSGWSTGPVGKTLTFDGSNDNVQLVNFPSPPVITLSAWVKANSGTSGFVVNKTFNGSSVPFSLCVANVANFGGMAFYNAAWRYSGVTTDIRGDGKWHLVAGTYDGVTLRYYVDGKLDASTAYSGTLPTSTATTSIGAYLADVAYFSGSINAVRIHSRVLTRQEISRLYADPWAGTLTTYRRPIMAVTSVAYNETLSDAITAGDSVAAVLAAIGSLSDAITAADVLAAALGAVASLSDAATAADGLVAALAAVASATDAATASDAAGAVLAALAALSEALAAADAAAIAGLPAPAARTVTAILRARNVVAREETRTVTAAHRSRTVTAQE